MTVKVEVLKEIPEDDAVEEGETIEMKKEEAKRHAEEGYVKILNENDKSEPDIEIKTHEPKKRHEGDVVLLIKIKKDSENEKTPVIKIYKDKKYCYAVGVLQNGKVELKTPDISSSKPPWQEPSRQLKNKLLNGLKKAGAENPEEILEEAAIRVNTAGGAELFELEEEPTDTDEQDEKTVIEKPSLILEDIMAEQVTKDGISRFSVWDGEKVTYKDKIDLGDKILKPVSDEKLDGAVKEGVVKLPTKAKDYEDVNSLIDEIKDFIDKWLDISDDFREMAAWYVLLSWVHDKLSVVPYLRFLGDYGTGKTRGNDTIGGVCYKAIDTGGCTSAAGIERLVEMVGGTMIMNEADFHNSDASADMVKILNEGFESSGAVVKGHQDDQKDIVITNPFSPKILSTRQRWEDQALESRCITEKMQETDRDDILPVKTREFHEKQEELRNKLLMFRFKKYREIDEEAITEIWDEIKSMNLERRLVQATISFSVLFHSDEEMFKRYKDFLKDHQKEMVKERASTFDGGLVKAVYEKHNDSDVDHVTPTKIADYMEDELNYKDVRPSTVGKHLKSLGLATKQKRIDGKVKRVLDVKPKQLRKVFKRYVPEFGGELEDYGNDGEATKEEIETVLNKMAENMHKDSFKTAEKWAELCEMDQGKVKRILEDVYDNDLVSRKPDSENEKSLYKITEKHAAKENIKISLNSQ